MSSRVPSIAFVTFSLLICLFAAATLRVSPALAQDDRPRIVVAVLASGEVPEATVRDIQDLFLTALAKHQEYELVDRQTVYQTTTIRSDVDLLLCVSQPSCIRQQHDLNRYEQYVLVKVDEAQASVKFTAVTFNYKNDKPIDFANPYTVPANNVDLLIDKAFSAAEEIKLVPVDAAAAVVVDPCASVTCDDEQTCVEGACIETEDTDLVEAPPDDEPTEQASIDWIMIGGYSAAGLGVVLGVTSLVFYLDAQSTLDEFSASYTSHGGAYVSDLTQAEGVSRVDSINSSAAIYEITLTASLVTLAAGAGLLAWRYLLSGEVDATDSTEPGPTTGLLVAPVITADGAGLGASIRF